VCDLGRVYKKEKLEILYFKRMPFRSMKDKKGPSTMYGTSQILHKYSLLVKKGFITEFFQIILTSIISED
jgi:hypothetical protein